MRYFSARLDVYSNAVLFVRIWLGTCASVRVLVQLRVMFGDVVLELVTSMDVDTGGRLPSRWFVHN